MQGCQLQPPVRNWYSFIEVSYNESFAFLLGHDLWLRSCLLGDIHHMQLHYTLDR